MSRCKACDKELTPSETRVRNRVTNEPEDLCKTCRAVGSYPDDVETITGAAQDEILMDDGRVYTSE